MKRLGQVLQFTYLDLPAAAQTAFETLCSSRWPVSLRVRCQISPRHAPLATRKMQHTGAAPQ